MNQPGASTIEPIVMGATNVALVEAAARDLEGFSEQVLTLGHSPSWGFPQVPDGLALCMGCWQLITAGQLGGERCPGTERQPGPLIAVTCRRALLRRAPQEQVAHTR
jgi:hypothetical protein